MRATGSMEEETVQPVARADAPRAAVAASPLGLTGSLPSSLHRERRYRRLLAAADLLATALVVALVFSPLAGADGQWAFYGLLIPVVLLGAKLLGLYDRDELVVRKTTLDDVPRAASLAMASVLIVGATGSVVLDEPITQTGDVAITALLLTLMLAGRAGARRAARSLTGPERCMLIGGPVACERLTRVFEDEPGVSLISSMQLSEAHALLAPTADPTVMRELITTSGIHRVVLDPEVGEHTEMTFDVLRGAKAHGLRMSVLPSLFDVIGTSVKLDEVGGLTLLGLHRFGLSRSSALVKRGFDVVVGGLALILSAPLMALIALAIRLDSPGPALFHQTRVGRSGRRFEIIKFRTMVTGAELRRAELEELNEAIGLFKIAADPRTTRLGRFLRRTSLDELPQLVNVLRGEMSLVGPRPLIPSEDSRIIGWDRRRLTLTPGMTGPWQIAGSARVPLNEMVRFDYRYAATWSMWTDIKILVRTIQFVFARRGL